MRISAFRRLESLMNFTYEYRLPVEVGRPVELSSLLAIIRPFSIRKPTIKKCSGKEAYVVSYQTNSFSDTQAELQKALNTV